MTDRDKLLHHIDSNLSAEQAREIEARIREDAELRAECDLLCHVQNRLRQRPAQPSPGCGRGSMHIFERKACGAVWFGRANASSHWPLPPLLFS